MAQQGESAGYYSQQPYQQPYQQSNQQSYQQSYQQPYQPPPGPPQNNPQYENVQNAEYQAPSGPPQNYSQYQQAPPPHGQDTEKFQGYAVPPPIYGDNGGNFAPPMDDKQTFQETFKIQKPKYNDVWAAVLLLATFFGFVAVSGLSLYRYSKYQNFNGGGIYNAGNDFSLNTNTLLLFIFVLVVAFVLSWLLFLAARMFTKQFIWIAGILNCVLAVGTAIYYLIKGNYSAGIPFAIFAGLTVFFFISWIKRIPFAVVMLQQAQDVARMKRVHVFTISLIGGLVASLFAAWFSITLVGIYTAYMPSNAGANANPACAAGGCSSGKVIGLVVFVTFAAYWITEVIKNVIHTVVAGVYGSWYFCAGKPGGIPKGATMGAFKRATTYSFGSISFGSLIVALINCLRQLCSIAQQESGGGIAGAVFCVLSCLIGLIEGIVQFLNRYAFCHIALYGKAFIPAAKDTWSMMKDRGIDALANDCLVSPVLSMTSLFVGYVCALLAYLYLQFTHPAYNSGGTFTPVIMAFSFLIGLQVCQIFMTPIGSGVDTIFVAMAWDPEIAFKEHPEFWQRLVHVYPKVQDKIHV